MSVKPFEVPPLAEQPIELLVARLALAPLFLITSAATAVPGREKETRQHGAYLEILESQRRLFGYGTLEPQAGSAASELSIIAASSLEEAVSIAEDDPRHVEGSRTNHVRPHTMNEGVACWVGRAMALRQRPAWTPAALQTDLTPTHQPGRGDAGALVQLVTLAPTDKPRPSDDLGAHHAHFVWLRENEMHAKLLSCGPVQSSLPLAPGIWGEGLGILATSKSEAAGIVQAEPSGALGYRSLSLRGWNLQRGLAAPIASALLALNRSAT